MVFNIVIAYNKYKYDSPRRYTGEYDKEELARAIEFINKNSYYNHNILIVTNNEEDIGDLKNIFDNIRIIKSKYVHRGDPSSLHFMRYNAELMEGINSLDNDELVCHAFWADTICGKNWDKYIIDAMQKYEGKGTDYVYVPMFVETRDQFRNIVLAELDPTPERIWDEWRKNISCHYLTMPTKKGYDSYITEKDIDYFIKRANEAGKVDIIEKPGDRIYGFFNTMIMKAKFAKKALKLEGIGFDIKFDDRLRDELHMMKVVVCRSFVFHPNCQFKYDK